MAQSLSPTRACWQGDGRHSLPVEKVGTDLRGQRAFSLNRGFEVVYCLDRQSEIRSDGFDGIVGFSHGRGLEGTAGSIIEAGVSSIRD